MYVETMKTDEKFKEFQRAFNKILDVSHKIIERQNLNKVKPINSEGLVDLGIHRLFISGTEYFYYLYAYKVKRNRGKYILAWSAFPYTIQTHKESRNKYIITFHSYENVNNNPEMSSPTCINQIVEIEYHLIKRYSERFLGDAKIDCDTALELFIKNNFDGFIYIFNNKTEASRVSEDGISLGDVIDPRIIKLKTFITFDMLRGNQVLWDKYGNLWNTFKEGRERNKANPNLLLL